MRKGFCAVLVLFFVGLAVLACKPSKATQVPTPKPTLTFTPTRELTPTAQAPTKTPTPKPTPTLTPTPKPTPTFTPKPTPTFTPTPKPTPTPTSPPRRLSTGTFIKQTAPLDGYGELEIHNGTNLDAVAVFTTLADEVIFAVYIQAHSKFTVSGIRDGTYKLYFMLGEDWDEKEHRFTRKVRRAVFEDYFPYTTTQTTAAVWSVTLHPVVGGTAETEDVSEAEFPPLR